MFLLPCQQFSICHHRRHAVSLEFEDTTRSGHLHHKVHAATRALHLSADKVWIPKWYLLTEFIAVDFNAAKVQLFPIHFFRFQVYETE